MGGYGEGLRGCGKEGRKEGCVEAGVMMGVIGLIWSTVVARDIQENKWYEGSDEDV